MTKMLTPEEWAAIEPPFYWIKICDHRWTQTQRDEVLAWIREHCGGTWLWHEVHEPTQRSQKGGYDLFVFGNSGDRVLFEMWISDNPVRDTV